MPDFGNISTSTRSATCQVLVDAIGLNDGDARKSGPSAMEFSTTALHWGDRGRDKRGAPDCWQVCTSVLYYVNIEWNRDHLALVYVSS
jgi:hypothetical protein